MTRKELIRIANLAAAKGKAIVYNLQTSESIEGMDMLEVYFSYKIELGEELPSLGELSELANIIQRRSKITVQEEPEAYEKKGQRFLHVQGCYKKIR